MRKLISYIALFCSCISVLKAEYIPEKNKMIRNLEMIAGVFEAKYAPFEWKKHYLDWSLESEISAARDRINQGEITTLHEYQQLMHAFFMSTADYHVRDFYRSAEFALLPFEIRSAGGRYFFSDIMTLQLELMVETGDYRSDILPQVGDELISFDGAPVEITIDKLKHQDLGNPDSPTAQVLAENMLTKRLGSLGHHVPQGNITIQFKRPTGQLVEAEMNWVYQSDALIQGVAKNMAHRTSDDISIKARYSKEMYSPILRELQADRTHLAERSLKRSENGRDVRPTRDRPNPQTPPLPAFTRHPLRLGKVIWKEQQPTVYDAYIYLTPETGKQIGYIRMSSYAIPHNVEDAQALPYLNKQAEQLSHILNYFEKRTEGLVIDQVDNGGGYLIYGYGVLSMLANKPLLTPRHRIAITPEDVTFAQLELRQLMDELEFSDAGISYVAGFPETTEVLKSQIAYNQFIIQEWEDNHTLTSAFPMFGIDEIMPHPLARYSKPIIVLVDRRDFSCADFVPAVLQDNGRAIIFGEKTAGAGGIVEKHSYPNLFGLAFFSYTTTIAERPNGLPLENLGVTPDVTYEYTPEDLLFGYRGYTEAVNATLESIL